MPVIRLLTGSAISCILLSAPLAAQTVVADAPNAATIPLTVPSLKGTDYPATLGPSRRGVPGRPRAFARVRVTLQVEPACSVRATSVEPLLIRCSGSTPYLAEIGSSADSDHAMPHAFAPVSQPPATPVAIAAPRLTVEY